MPRRKKKSSLATRPSLVFTESPVHVQNNVPSPVLCARCPPTANSIPVDELHNLSWVSPQFRNVRLSGGQGKRKLTRQRRHSVAGHRNVATSYSDNNSLNKENTALGSRNKLRKFNSLRFIGDKSNIPSIIEDVEVSIEDQTESEETEREDGDQNEIADNDSQCHKCLENRQSRNKGHIHKRDLERNNYGANIQEESETALNINREVNEVFENDGNKLDEHHERSSSGEITDLNVTRNRKHSVMDKPPIKRLFASQLLVKADSEDQECVDEMVDNEKIVQNKTKLNDDSLIVPDSESDSANSPHIRRSERIRELGKMLANCESPCSYRKLTCQTVVLAPNTPENEYGWSKRKRQLITYLKKKS
ncbi:uncharacterized protein LOC132721989 [Ruditapes philippinarum]|uniref:uncharacterized protein LOC132721989 n=1 Tax=Ruditapes philippinarum TaxID=129788 RepID=UPI00295BB058|nr:uncharacterized protein LOC132721989 [Ruditapes philippinarum]